MSDRATHCPSCGATVQANVLRGSLADPFFKDDKAAIIEALRMLLLHTPQKLEGL